MRSLELTTMIGCPLRCSICPQDNLKNAYSGKKYMSLDDLKLVLSKLPVDVKIIFAGYSEPWANPEATNMLEYTLEQGRTIQIYTTLFGMKDPQRVLDLLKKYRSQVEQCWLHLPDDSGNMPGYTPGKHYNTTIELFATENFYAMTMNQNNNIHPSLKKFNVKVNSWQFHTRADNIIASTGTNVDLIAGFNNEFIVECVREKNLEANVLLPNGDVTLCCMDYSLKHVIGNLYKQTYDEILENIKLIKEKNHILYDKSTLCRTCQDTYHRTPWNDKEVYEMVKLNDPDRLGL